MTDDQKVLAAELDRVADDARRLPRPMRIEHIHIEPNAQAVIGQSPAQERRR